MDPTAQGGSFVVTYPVRFLYVQKISRLTLNISGVDFYSICPLIHRAIGNVKVISLCSPGIAQHSSWQVDIAYSFRLGPKKGLIPHRTGADAIELVEGEFFTGEPSSLSPRAQARRARVAGSGRGWSSSSTCWTRWARLGCCEATRHHREGAID